MTSVKSPGQGVVAAIIPKTQGYKRAKPMCAARTQSRIGYETLSPNCAWPVWLGAPSAKRASSCESLHLADVGKDQTPPALAIRYN